MSPYIQSLRPRTLPLSMSGIILGTGLAWSTYPQSPERKGVWVFILAILTTLSLQILSNLSNELGDAQKGTDKSQQSRAIYGLQAGTITEKQIKGMIGLFMILCIVFGTALIYCAFGMFFCAQSMVFFVLGALAIAGAMAYTLGRHSYGYIGLGDLGVFMFFGLLSTLGGYYLQVQTLSTEIWVCGTAIGLPCVGVLNLNNIRDMDNDRTHGKHTFASMLGQQGSKIYHTCLLAGCLLLFAAFGHWWTWMVAPLWVWHIWYIFHNEGSRLDLQMPVLMFSTLIVACVGWL
ncbi:MAG: 1,4-dihydroxy-2-naphthoate octaprenyltransferase [Paludibacteraceae bacterium]|nr:1,4-dihydroxy-2-naphthoate octaprenyltransferase [Paludibacteraceae bacterium]